MVKLGLSIDEDAGEAAGADDDLPELEENVDEGSRMEEVGAGRGGRGGQTAAPAAEAAAWSCFGQPACVCCAGPQAKV